MVHSFLLAKIKDVHSWSQLLRQIRHLLSLHLNKPNLLGVVFELNREEVRILRRFFGCRSVKIALVLLKVFFMSVFRVLFIKLL